MRTETLYFVRFYALGSFIGEQWEQPIPDPDPYLIAWPDNVYAFRILKREDAVDGEKRYKGETEYVGPLWYHPDSVIESLEEIRKNPKATRILISNMECNRWESMIWTRWGNWPQPFNAAEMRILGK